MYKDRNITVASQNLYISQQGMSKSIANLEKEVGFPLFKRSVSGVKPTAEAGELYSYFRTVMKSYAGLQKKVNDIEMRKNGVLSIVWPEFFALSCEKEEYATFSGQNRISLPSQSTAPRRESLLLAANYYLSYFFFFSHSYRKPTILKRMCFFEPLF